MIDKDIHGKVTPENFCKLWPEDGGEIAKQVSSIIDDDGDGNLSFEEILAFRGNSTFPGLTMLVLRPNSPGPLTNDWKVTDDSSVNFHDLFFFIFCQIIAKNEEKHVR